jgi:hypothetical protein
MMHLPVKSRSKSLSNLQICQQSKRSLSRTAFLGVAACLMSCVTIYHPLSGLHAPIVIDTDVENFHDTRLIIQCIPNGFDAKSRARRLCAKVGRLFRNQGAEVITLDSKNPIPQDSPPAKAPLQQEGNIANSLHKSAKHSLTIELRDRVLHRDKKPLLWLLSFLTLTLVPATSEYSFAQDVIIRDSSGFLLASQSLKGRLIRYFGVTAWLGHKLLDVFVREEDEQMGGDRAEIDFSNDYYNQLSQMTFNAKMRQKVLQAQSRGGG